MQRARKVKDMRTTFGWLTKAKKIPALETISVTATPLVTDRRSMQDVGACFPAVKAAIDGLVDAGVIVDDDPRYLKALTFNAPEVGEVNGLRLEVESL